MAPTALTPAQETPAKAPWLAAQVARWSFGVTRLGMVRAWVGTKRWWARQCGALSFTAQSADGVELAAMYLPPPAPTQVGYEAPADGSASSSPRLPIVLAHGYCETKEFHLHRARRLNQLGHAVIVFDHRAHGRSGGKSITFGVQERHDVTAVINAAAARGWVDGRVITMGYSLGAAVMLQHAAIDGRVAGVVALAPFVDSRTAIESFRRKLAPWLQRQWVLAGFEHVSRQTGFNLDDASPRLVVEQLRMPILIITGSHDSNLPQQFHGRVLADLLRQGNGRLYEVQGANHITLAHRSWPGMDDQIAAFCASLGARHA